jgi:hypothetical protein
LVGKNSLLFKYDGGSNGGKLKKKPEAEWGVYAVRGIHWPRPRAVITRVEESGMSLQPLGRSIDLSRGRSPCPVTALGFSRCVQGEASMQRDPGMHHLDIRIHSRFGRPQSMFMMSPGVVTNPHASEDAGSGRFLTLPLSLSLRCIFNLQLTLKFECKVYNLENMRRAEILRSIDTDLVHILACGM